MTVRYRNKDTGDPGELVTVDGVVRIKRPGVVEAGRIWEHEEKSGKWILEKDTRSFTPSQAASIAFAADRALCALIGKHVEGSQVWQQIRPEVRKEFMASGPPMTDALRRRVYEAICGALSEGSEQA